MVNKDKTLEEILLHLRHALFKRNLTIKSVLKIFSGKIKIVLLIVLSVCAFVCVPGLTILFGCLITYVGIRMVMGKRVWLPQKILHRTAPNKFLRKVANRGIWLSKKIEKFSHSRYLYMFDNPFMKVMNGLLIAVLGLLIAFVPLPFVAMAPAAIVFLMSVGLLERDGLFIIIGYVCVLLGAAVAVAIRLYTH